MREIKPEDVPQLMREGKLVYRELRRVLNYDKDTGIFRRLISNSNSVKVGDVAGFRTSDNYIGIGVNGKIYRAHNLAWLYVYGYFPENEIDHINRRRDDNRIINLREVSHQCNMRNIGNFSHNTSGVKGVSWDMVRNKWLVRVKINHKAFNIGRFDDFDEAVLHRLAVEQCVGWYGCDKNSPAHKYAVENKLIKSTK